AGGSPPAEVLTMRHKKLSRNAPCPCGSGKPYEACCWDKGLEWVEDEAGTVFRSTPMTPEVREALDQLRRAFIARHGREPGPDDPLFPDMPHPEHLEAMMVEDMKAAGLDPAFIYAFEKTGLLVTEHNQHLIPENELAEWDGAIEEYERKHRRQEGTGYILQFRERWRKSALPADLAEWDAVSSATASPPECLREPTAAARQSDGSRSFPVE